MLRGVFLSFAVAALAALSPTAKANVFDMPAGQTSQSFVTVADPGNVADSFTGFGAVGYTYQMGTYDVTLAQYTQFLNAVAATDQYGCYNSFMAGNGGTFPFGIAQNGSAPSYTYSVYGGTQAVNMPLYGESWGDAARFVNWLDNGQPNTGVENLSTTESGAYYLNGAISKSALNAVASPPHSGSGAPTYFLPTQNEWYKAAYYAGGGTSAGYWAFPTQSDIGLDNSLALAASESNDANFNNGTSYTDPVNGLTPVGTFALSPGPYGTYDMGGDVAQWNETITGTNQRGARGGDYFDLSSHFASYGGYVSSTDTTIGGNIGIRVASSGGVHWAAAVGGSWATAANWIPNSVPNAPGALAEINAPTTSPITITLDGPQTVGSLLLGNSANSATGYTLSAGSAGRLTLDNAGSVATITVTDGSHVISAPVVLAAGLLVTPSVGATLTISGNLSETAPSALTLAGPGRLVLSGSGSYSGGTIVNAGTLSVAASSALGSGGVTVNGGALDATAGPLSVASLSIGSSGTLNLHVGNVLNSSSSATFAIGSTLNISNSAAIVLPDLLMTYSGAANGTFTNVNGLPAADQLFYNTGGSLEIISSTPMWNQGNGNWSMGTNWSGNASPNGPGAGAALAKGNSGAVAINLDVPVTIGALEFASSTASYTIYSLSGNTLTFSNSGSASTVGVLSGTHTINTALYLQGGSLDISASNSSILTIAGNISEDGNGESLILGGDGTAQLVLSGTNTYTGSTLVNAGSLIVDYPSALPTGTSLLVGGRASTIFGPVAGPALASPGVGAVPEPGTVALVIAGLVFGLGFMRGRNLI